jgi:hypothetical protein
MSEFPKVRRILRVHAAHRTVGVSGVASPLCARSRCEPFSTTEPETQPLTVLLVSTSDDDLSRAALAAFERILVGRDNVRCERADLALAKSRGLAHCDCAVVSVGGRLQVIGHWSAYDAEGVSEQDARESAYRSGDKATKIEIADAARWHPLLDGVGPFTVPRSMPTVAISPANATPLLVTRSSGGTTPIAWAQHSDSRAIYTSLGHVEDLGRPDFVRLLLNATEWVRR